MRSTMFLLMLALCLVSLVCAASTEEGGLERNTENKPTALGTPTSLTSPEDPAHDVQNTHLQSSEKTTKKPVPPVLQTQTGTPSQKQPQVQEPQQPSSTITSHTSGVKEGEQGGVTEHRDDNPLNKEITPPEHPERTPVNHSPPQNQPKQTPLAQTQPQPQPPQQVQAPPTNKSQSPEKSPEPTGDVLQPVQTEPLTSRAEEESRDALAKTPTKSAPGVTDHQDSPGLQQTPKDRQQHSAHKSPGSTNQLSSSSQTSGTGVQQTLERPSPKTNTDKTATEGTHLSPNHSERSPKDHHDAQVSPLISTDGKTNLPDNNKIPNTTADKIPVAAQKPEPLTPAAADNVTTQTATTTGDKDTHSAQTSETSTAEPVKEEFTLPTNTSKKLPKVMQSLNMTDSSIGSLSHFFLAALTIFIVMAVAPAS